MSARLLTVKAGIWRITPFSATKDSGDFQCVCVCVCVCVCCVLWSPAQGHSPLSHTPCMQIVSLKCKYAVIWIPRSAWWLNSPRRYDVLWTKNFIEQFTQHRCNIINQDVSTRGSSSADNSWFIISHLCCVNCSINFFVHVWRNNEPLQYHDVLWCPKVPPETSNQLVYSKNTFV